MPRAEYRTDRRIDAYIKSLPAWQAAKDHVNIFIYDPIAPDPEGIINQGQAIRPRVQSRSGQVRR